MVLVMEECLPCLLCLLGLLCLACLLYFFYGLCDVGLMLYSLIESRNMRNVLNGRKEVYVCLLSHEMLKK